MFHVKHPKPENDPNAARESIRRAFSQAGIPLSAAAENCFVEYREALLNWNSRVNLISRNDENRIVDRHFLESALLAQLPGFRGAVSVLDIGTGAGFPGLPLKIVQPEIQLTLLDSKRMKTLFLKDLVRKLDLNDVEIVCGRAEAAELQERFRGKFDVVVSRAVAEINQLFSISRYFLRPGGSWLTIKGSDKSDEIDRFRDEHPQLQLETQPLAFGASQQTVITITVPHSKH